MFIIAILVLCGLLYLAVFYMDNFLGNRNRPPGPYRFPPFGNLIQMGLTSKFAHVALDKMGKEHGDAMSIKMGFVEAVVFSSHEAVRAVYPRDEASGRECAGILWDRNLKQNLGLNFSNGPEHTETRKFCRDTLRLYGYGNRESMQLLVLDELTEFVAFMETTARSNCDRTIHFDSDYFTKSFLNLMSKLVMGKRYDYNDPDFHKLLEGMNDTLKNGFFGSGIMIAYPFLRHIFPESLGYNAQMKGIRLMGEVALNHLGERKKFPYKDQPECFTDHFLQKMEENSNKTHPIFTADNFSIIFADITAAGSETTSNVVNFVVLFLATYPSIQEKVYQEILHVIGTYRLPNLENRLQMPYTQAVLLEAIRWNRSLVFGAPRKALDDFMYRDQYQIKKGTVLMYNLQSIFFNKEVWGDPQVFRPERFLDNGKINEQKSNIVQIAFGAGKRNCFGEVLARDSLFLYVTTLIQKFKFALPPGYEPDLEPGIGITLYAKPYSAIVTLREESG